MSDDICKWANDTDWDEYSSNTAVTAKLTDLRKLVNAINGSSSSSSSNSSSSSSGESDSESSSSGESSQGDGERIKLVVVGDGAVGKTSLLISYATGEFPEEYVPTVFENYSSKIDFKNQTVFLHLWDTAGQEDYDRLRPLSYPNSDIVFLVFATTSKNSFLSIEEKWHPEIAHYLPDIPFILVGSKVDLRDANEKDKNAESTEYVTKKEGQELADQIDAVCYVELSSKTRQGLEEAFELAVEEVFDQRGLNASDDNKDAKSDASTNDKDDDDKDDDKDNNKASSSNDKKNKDDDKDDNPDKPKRRQRKKKKEKKACVLL